MVYETSYDTGLKPFIHDKDRGKWSSPMDFLFACIGHAFKVDAVIILPSLIFREIGIYTLVPYLITLALCVVPIVFMQSFLGQFSSTGFISVFRIAPLFKGIGYVSLAINLTTLTYYSVFGAIPLFFFFHTLRSTIPWSCEGAASWMVVPENLTSACSINVTAEKYNEIVYPSMEFFKERLGVIDAYQDAAPEGTFSWGLMTCTLLIWAAMAGVLTRSIQTIGRFVRYSCLTTIGIISLLVLRLAFLPGALGGLRKFFEPNFARGSWVLIPVMAFSALGPGWGSVLTMASYNNFKTNIYKHSWIMCLAQFGIIMGLALISIFMTCFLQKDSRDNVFFAYVYSQWMDFLTIPTGLTFIEMPHFWSVLFFGMLILGCLNLLITQLLSVLTSLFDEYEVLREWKREVTFAAVSILALTSIYFCSNHGISFFEELMKFSLLTQMILNLLLLIMVLWVYGRERFQRDVNFMTSRTYSTCMVNVVRFVSPIFIIFGLLIGILISLDPSSETYSWTIYYLVMVIVLAPWCFIPGYCIFKVMQTTGSFGMRLRRSVRPTDWYPVETEERQKYEVTFNNTDISHQLTTEAVAVE